MYFIVLVTFRHGDEAFKKYVEQMIGEMKALPKTPGTEEIFMPGEIESRKRQKRQAEGLVLPDSVYEELKALSVQYQVDFTI